MKNQIRTRDSRGGVAVFIALLSAMLLTIAALGVDLGNAWARKQSVQKQVDVSAISAGAMLPVTDTNRHAIAAEVASYLNKSSNVVRGQDEVSAQDLLDGDLDNGEIRFEAKGVADSNSMRVIAPRARVDFGFANLFGASGVDVNAEATVQVRTPLPDVTDVLPMWLPAACVFGQVGGDIGAPPPPPDASPLYTLNSPRGGHYTGTVDPPSTVYGSTVDVTVSITGIPSNQTGATVRFTFGNTKWVDYPVTWSTPTSSNDERTVTMTVGPDVTSTSGAWEVWPIVDGKYPKQQGGNANQGRFQVTDGGQVACNEHQRGNFGQLDSPRAGVSQKQTVYALNVARGLDHQLAVFSNAPETECFADGSPAGALIDNRPLDGRNCLYVDPGNDPIGLTDGLFAGVAGYPGRLRSVMTSPCGRANSVVGGYVVNNDTLSCYLKPGYTLADIAKDTGVPPDALNASIYDSPRFFWVPVVYEGDRLHKKYLAIKAFAPAFLTDESITSSRTSTDATPLNGLVLNPAGKVQSVQLFAFNAVALPAKPNAQTVDYQPGTAKVVRLID